MWGMSHIFLILLSSYAPAHPFEDLAILAWKSPKSSSVVWLMVTPPGNPGWRRRRKPSLSSSMHTIVVSTLGTSQTHTRMVFPKRFSARHWRSTTSRDLGWWSCPNVSTVWMNRAAHWMQPLMESMTAIMSTLLASPENTSLMLSNAALNVWAHISTFSRFIAWTGTHQWRKLWKRWMMWSRVAKCGILVQARYAFRFTFWEMLSELTGWLL